jgi:hypothetical protein
MAEITRALVARLRDRIGRRMDESHATKSRREDRRFAQDASPGRTEQ